MKALHPLLLAATLATASAAPLAKTVLYVTQMPIPDEVFTQSHIVAQTRMNISSAMQSPLADTIHAGRGGALWIRYPDGTKRNLTSLAGYGGPVDANGNATGLQGVSSIVVQRPFLHWGGAKAVFAMIVGGPANAADVTVFHWQLYEVTNFAQGQTPVITYVTGQPANYNNMQACYDTQDRLIFVSDAPRAMQTQIYPQLDEYLSQACNTGLWRLDRTSGNQLKHIIHAPSGAFTPFVDSAGRVMFVQWDHQSRDTTATYDRPPIAANGDAWTQTFNGNGTYDSEAANATFTQGTQANYATYNSYPEPRNFDKTAFVGTNVNANTFNQFFPWECREDGSSHEVQNHVGRHEFGGSIARASFNDDPNLVQLNITHPISTNFLHLVESPFTPGTFYAVSPPELGTHSAGPILRYSGGINVNPDSMQVTYLTSTTNIPNPALGQSPLTTAADIYRNPTPLSDGSLLAVHAAVTQYDSNSGADATHPASRYAFRLRMLQTSGSILVPDTVNNPTSPANVSLTYYAGGALITYSGAPLWELDPVEVVARTRPAQLASPIPAVEQGVFDSVGVDAPTMQAWMRTNNFALAASRNSTRRDAADKQQPFNLKVAWSSTQTIANAGKLYDIGWMQFIQADALRAYTFDGANPNAPVQPGRRILPVPLHDTVNQMPSVPGAPPGAVKLGNDGSWAAILPAGRALSWHLLDGAGTKSQIKERYWISFAPGEVRTCAVCHGVNTSDQAGNSGAPTNPPQALATLLQYWKSNNPPGTMQHANASSGIPKANAAVSLQVTRSAGSTGPVSVGYATASGTAVAGTDFTGVNGALSWSDGDVAPKSITVPLLQNPAIAPDKSFSVNLSAPVNGSLGAITTNVVTIMEKPFDAWRVSHFGAAASTAGTGTALDDPDKDGLSNAVEYGFALDPNSATSAALPQPVRMGSNFGFVFNEPPGVTGVTYIVESSPDLSLWTSVPDHGSGAMHDFTQAITGAGRRYYRITVVIQ